MRCWYDAIAAVATTQTVLGDKDNAAKTKLFFVAVSDDGGAGDAS